MLGSDDVAAGEVLQIPRYTSQHKHTNITSDTNTHIHTRKAQTETRPTEHRYAPVANEKFGRTAIALAMLSSSFDATSCAFSKNLAMNIHICGSSATSVQ